MRWWQRFGLAVLWMAFTVALLTGWDVVVQHQAFSASKLLLRVVIFLLAATVLSLLLGRLQGRRRSG